MLFRSKKGRAGGVSGGGIGSGGSNAYGNGNAAFYSRARSHINPVSKVEEGIDLVQRAVNNILKMEGLC